MVGVAVKIGKKMPMINMDRQKSAQRFTSNSFCWWIIEDYPAASCGVSAR